jgi:hypothetical protein
MTAPPYHEALPGEGHSDFCERVYGGDAAVLVHVLRTAELKCLKPGCTTRPKYLAVYGWPVHRARPCCKKHSQRALYGAVGSKRYRPEVVLHIADQLGDRAAAADWLAHLTAHNDYPASGLMRIIQANRDKVAT